MSEGAEMVKVLTSKSVRLMFEESGTGIWAANAERVTRCKYVIMVRNHSLDRSSDEDWVSRDDIPHGTAFLIGRGLSTIPHEKPGRITIAFREYAEVNLPNSWDGRKNPVAYLNESDLELDLSSLEWKPFPRELAVPELHVRPLTISEAKQGLAKSLGISVDNIEIIIRA